MAKRVLLKAKAQPAAVSPDQWVSGQAETPERAGGAATAPAAAMKRLTIDIPGELHTRVKMQCAARGRKMADEIRDLLEGHFKAD
jgi:hypothetical protein